MSGVGKTTLSNLLQDSGWYHYSVDYRIGTRYMGEHIVDNFKREAMRVPFLRDLLLSDSIHIQSNITFDHLKPLSTYLGKPGNPDKGGISFAEYRHAPDPAPRGGDLGAARRPGLHRQGAGDLPVRQFRLRFRRLASARWWIPSNPLDPVLSCLAENTLLLYIEGTPEHTRMLVERFRKHPKPMYYQPQFLEKKWAEYKALNGIAKDDEVDPDGFAVWGFEQLLHHRIPLYKAIADNFGYTIRMRDVPDVQSEEDFTALVANAIDQAQ